MGFSSSGVWGLPWPSCLCFIWGVGGWPHVTTSEPCLGLLSTQAPPYGNAKAPRLFTCKVRGHGQAIPMALLAQTSKTLRGILGGQKQARGSSGVQGWRPSQQHFLSRSLLQAPVEGVLADHLHSAQPSQLVWTHRGQLGPLLLIPGTQTVPHTWHRCLLSEARQRASQPPSHFLSPCSPQTEV